jgi:hypothetical protein
MAARAEIEFLTPGSERPFTYAREAPSGAEPETARFVGHTVEIRDLVSPGVRPYAIDPERAKALWARSEELVGERF